VRALAGVNALLEPLRVSVESEFFDFGTPVEVAVPPADQVTRIAGAPPLPG
jgi:hypothetical protein